MTFVLDKPTLLLPETQKLIRPPAPYLSRAHVQSILRELEREKMLGGAGASSLAAQKISGSTPPAFISGQGTTNNTTLDLSAASVPTGSFLVVMANNFSTTVPADFTSTGMTFTSRGSTSGNSNASKLMSAPVPGGWGGVITHNGTRCSAVWFSNVTTMDDIVGSTTEGTSASFATIGTLAQSKLMCRFVYGAQDEALEGGTTPATMGHDSTVSPVATGASRTKFWSKQGTDWAITSGTYALYNYRTRWSWTLV